MRLRVSRENKMRPTHLFSELGNRLRLCIEIFIVAGIEITIALKTNVILCMRYLIFMHLFALKHAIMYAEYARRLRMDFVSLCR